MLHYILFLLIVSCYVVYDIVFLFIVVLYFFLLLCADIFRLMFCWTGIHYTFLCCIILCRFVVYFLRDTLCKSFMLCLCCIGVLNVVHIVCLTSFDYYHIIDSFVSINVLFFRIIFFGLVMFCILFFVLLFKFFFL